MSIEVERSGGEEEEEEEARSKKIRNGFKSSNELIQNVLSWTEQPFEI